MDRRQPPSRTSTNNCALRDKYSDPEVRATTDGIWHIASPLGNFTGVGLDWRKHMREGGSAEVESSVAHELNALVSIKAPCRAGL